MKRQRRVTQGLLFSLLLIIAGATPVDSEEVTITTYYPSPYGVYDDLVAMNSMGIGTVSPAQDLEVYDDSFGSYVRIKGVGDSYQFSGIELYSDETTDKAWKILHRQNVANQFAILETDDATYWNWNFVIDPGGNVGIGTTSPQHKLDVDGAMYSRRNALTDGATIAVDWNDGNVQSVTLGGNRTFTFSNGQDGGKYTLIIKPGAIGSRTVNWPATVRWPGGTLPTLTTTASKTDYIGFIYNGVDSKYDGVAQSLNY